MEAKILRASGSSPRAHNSVESFKTVWPILRTQKIMKTGFKTMRFKIKVYLGCFYLPVFYYNALECSWVSFQVFLPNH